MSSISASVTSSSPLYWLQGLLAAALLVGCPTSGEAKVFYSREEALELAFPGADRVEAETYVLSGNSAALQVTFGDPPKGGWTKTYNGVSKVVGYGGLKNDTIDASATTGVTIEFYGEDGNDTLITGTGGGSGQTIFEGNEGKDKLDAVLDTVAADDEDKGDVATAKPQSTGYDQVQSYLENKATSQELRDAEAVVSRRINHGKRARFRRLLNQLVS